MATTPNNNVSKPSRDQINAFRSDMFGRTKVSDAFTLFDASHRYSQNGDFSDVTSGTASATHIPEQSTAALTVGTASGDKLYRETKKVFSYQPGKSLQVLQTFVFAPAKTNLRQRAGYFSVHNGFYLELDGTTVNFVRRSYASGNVVEVRVPQSEWNLDKLDGTGPSDVLLDLSKAQILWSEYEWLGVGSVRLGFAIDGIFIEAHQFNHANNIDTVYMTTASLPCRYEIENTGTTASSSTMKQICISVISNGGYQKQSISWTASRTTAVSVGTTYYPLVAIRLAAGREDSVILPANFAALPSTDGNFVISLIRNPASITGGTWSTHSNDNIEYNNSATSMSGGTVVGEYFLAGGSGPGNSGKSAAVGLDINGLANFALQLGRTNASSVGGPVSDVYVVAAKTLSGTGSVVGSISWFDLL
jgi:hypothetical protein